MAPLLLRRFLDSKGVYVQDEWSGRSSPGIPEHIKFGPVYLKVNSIKSFKGEQYNR